MPGQQISEEEVKNMSPEQIAELQKKNCIFCHIASGKIPSKKVYEDEQCFAILDINPAAKGHLLLIPKEHFSIVPQAPESIVKHLGVVSKKLSFAAIRALGVQGTNIFIANGYLAGQKAPHVIIHIIPRTEGDGIAVFDLPPKIVREDDLRQIQLLFTQKLGTTSKKEESPKKEQKNLEEIDLSQLKRMLQ